MAKVGAQRAAVLTGRSKSTIQRAMNSGKLSYSLDQNDRRVIDVSELERVFGIQQQSLNASVENETSTTEDLVAKERMSMQIRMLEQQLITAQEHICDLKDQRDKWEKQATQILITSQYTQKQADELRAEIKDRDEKARLRRMQQMSGKRLTSQVRKLKPENENAGQSSASRFLFWKKAKA